MFQYYYYYQSEISEYEVSSLLEILKDMKSPNLGWRTLAGVAGVVVAVTQIRGDARR